MQKRIIYTATAPNPVGPYSQAVAANGFVFCSGQIPIDPVTNAVLDADVAGQTELVMNNLQAVLAAAGSSLDEVVKTTIFLADMNDFPVVNKVYGSFFDAESAPARATIQVGRLPKDVRVEIDAIAIAR